MPQVLKEEIREQIRTSALGEFYKKGYKSATLRGIAAKAGIPTGLIYSYFKNKEDLFKSVVKPATTLLNEMVLDDFPDTPENNLYNHELPVMLKCIEYFHRELVILIDKSEGSTLSGIKDDIINDITQHLKITPFFSNTRFDEVFYHILATNFMEGLFEIARHYNGKQWATTMLDLLIQQHLNGINSLSEYWHNKTR